VYVPISGTPGVFKVPVLPQPSKAPGGSSPNAGDELSQGLSPVSVIIVY
jgi:hypothetical protein